MRSVRLATGAALLCLAACRTDRITTVDPVVDGAEDAWSGGTLVLRSLSFTGADTVPVVLLGADTLVARAQGTDSALVALPDTNGIVTLTVRLRSGLRRALSVHVHGLAAVRDGPLLDQLATVYPWPGNGNPTALAVRGGQLVLWNLRTMALSGPLTSDTGLGCHRSSGFAPLPSATVPNLVVHFGACYGFSGQLLAVSMAPAAEPPDTGPLGASEPAAHLSRGKWLATGVGSTGFSVYTRLPSGGFTQTPGLEWEALGVVVSPRGDRIAPTWAYTGSPPGVPIYDAATGAAAYHIVAFPYYGGPAAFTAGGDTVFVAGEDSVGESELVALDATSGTVLARTPLLTAYYSEPLGLAVDPVRPFVYVVAWSDRPYLDVLDRNTLRRIVTLRTPTRIARTLNSLRAVDGWPWTIVVNPLDRRLYAIPRTNAPVEPYVFEYELMP